LNSFIPLIATAGAALLAWVMRDPNLVWTHERLAGTLGADGRTLRRRCKYKGSRKSRSAKRRLARASQVGEWLRRKSDHEFRSRTWSRSSQARSTSQGSVSLDSDAWDSELMRHARSYLGGADLVKQPNPTPVEVLREVWRESWRRASPWVLKLFLLDGFAPPGISRILSEVRS
jgi:hypothetical protein